MPASCTRRVCSSITKKTRYRLRPASAHFDRKKVGSREAAALSHLTALKAKGYPYQFVFSEASGHVERAVEMQTLPEAFEWAWRGLSGYRPEVVTDEHKR